MRNINELFFHGPSSLMMFSSLILSNLVQSCVWAIIQHVYFSPDDNDDFLDVHLDKS